MIKVLDCTLRDGGYINDWEFGEENIAKILNNLNNANIDIIEVGFLEDYRIKASTSDNTFFNSVAEIEVVLPEVKKCNQYVAMTRFGYLDLEKLAPYDGKSIDGIRVTFHIDDIEEALEYCDSIKKKGYNAYVQPVGTTMYTDEQILQLVSAVNMLEPYAFYVVDTLGIMGKEDLLRVFYLVNHNLNGSIRRGFHSHNNLQLSFSNAQILNDLELRNDIIVDSSVDGMGRGAGNLHTELITAYVNRNSGHTYLIENILEIIDEYIASAREKYVWGYSIPYYLAAVKNCHPNYASYLINKKTLPIKSISSLLEMIPENKRELFNNKLMDELYFNYQSNQVDDSSAYAKIKSLLYGKVLLVAPGNSVMENSEELKAYVEKSECTVISINHISEVIEPDLVFFSNDYRYQQYIEKKSDQLENDAIIVTSNIHDGDSTLVVNYSSLLNEIANVRDNATLMVIKMFENLEYKEVSIAGFDGYEISKASYVDGNMNTRLDESEYIKLNDGISKYLLTKGPQIELKFLTPSVYKR